MKESKDDLLMERITRSLEGLEMLAAMWIEKAVPAGEIWVGEGPDRDLARRPWRPEGRPTGAGAPLPGSLEHRLGHIEERLDRLASDIANLEGRVHEEQLE
jgi:hypothetical protein